VYQVSIVTPFSFRVVAWIDLLLSPGDASGFCSGRLYHGKSIRKRASIKRLTRNVINPGLDENRVKISCIYKISQKTS
jgi:hypothetical protein